MVKLQKEDTVPMHAMENAIKSHNRVGREYGFACHLLGYFIYAVERGTITLHDNEAQDIVDKAKQIYTRYTESEWL